MRKQTAESFWSKVDKSNDCWVWTGYCKPNGYGNTTWGSKSKYAHRVAAWLYEIIDDLDSELAVLHKCDNPKCCNPKHLFAGSSADNSRDMTNKNRQARGNKIRIAKLNEKIVKEIRNSNESQRSLAKKYGVNHTTVGAVINKSSWKHI
jgi:hypothetical protein